jgi:hypothetical protein
MTKLVLKILIFLVVLASTFGFILPFLISAKSTFAVIGGLVLLAFLILGCVFALERSLFNEKSGE